MRLCCMERPYLVPHDADRLKSAAMDPHLARAGDLPSSCKRLLYEGTSLDRYTMMSCPNSRKVLCALAEGKTVSLDNYNSLMTWVSEHRPEMKPYIQVEVSPLPLSTLLDLPCATFYPSLPLSDEPC
jgi:hypothetical protein